MVRQLTLSVARPLPLFFVFKSSCFALLAFVVLLLHVGPAQATTCANAIVIDPASLPIVDQVVICGSADDLNDANVPGLLCYGGGSPLFKNGKEALYEFTPTTSDSYVLSYAGQEWSAAMIYVGCPTLNNCLHGSGDFNPTVNFTVNLNAGTTYYIWFDAWPDAVIEGACPGTFSLGPPPSSANDDPCDATELTVDADMSCTSQTPGSLADATHTTTVGTSPCAGNPNDDVWFKFTATGPTHYIFLNDVAGSTTDLVLGVYGGTCGSLTNIRCIHALNCSVTGLTPGETYWVRVFSYSNATGANTTFNVCVTTPAPPPACDEMFYDDGGPSGNYFDNTNVTTTICPSAPGSMVSLVFSIFDLDFSDEFAVFDGNSTVPPPMATFYGNTLPPTLTATNATGCLTVAFYSDNDENHAGWAAQVECSPTSSPGCGENFYDDGGPSGDYGPNSNTTTTICPSIPEEMASLIFSQFDLENDHDMLSIYDGNSAASPLLGTFTGTALPPILTSSDPSGCLTAVFTSDGSVQNAGWAAEVLCAPMPTGTCIYALHLHDSNGDGWGTSQVRVSINTGPWTYYTVTGSDNLVFIGVNIGDLILVEYVANGPDQGQNSYTASLLGEFPYFTSTTPPATSPTFSQIVTCIPPPAAPQDCVGGVTLCTSLTINNSSSSTGNVVDLDDSNQGCLQDGENQGSWYFFSPQTAGVIGFAIHPTNGSDDYDFAVWGPFADAQCPTELPARCTFYDGSLGGNVETGMGNGATDTSEGLGGTADGWVKPLTVFAGEVYVLYIDNASTSGQAFTLDWDLDAGSSLDCTVLPMELIELQATARKSVIDVAWATASEKQTDRFDVQRSNDDQAYTTIGTLPAAGDAQWRNDYLFTDDAPMPGANYYRLEEVDRDGTRTFTHSVVAFSGETGADPVLFPNPAKEILNVSFTAFRDGNARFTITDVLGRKRQETVVEVERGPRTERVPLHDLSAGCYSLSITLPSGVLVQAGSFVKQ